MEKPQRGFTLIELLVAVAIVSILAAIALPAYNNYVLRGKLTEAINNLSAVRVSLEQYYQDNRNYGSTATTCGVDPTTFLGSNAKYFTYSCKYGSTSNNQSFIVTATGVNPGQTNGFTFTIDQSNNKATTAVPAGSGWQTNASCWVTKPGGSC